MTEPKPTDAPVVPVTPPVTETPAPPAVTPRRRRLVFAGKIALVVVALWLLLAYVILPVAWTHYEHQPKLANAPKTTLTAQGIPGDPLNVALIGTESDVVHAMLAAGWSPADPVTLRTSVRIARSVLTDRPYRDAPVSPLFVFGRKQDLAFEVPVGASASHRHHVRFWHSEEFGRAGTPLWIGAVTFDRSVGLSHRTGQITHHIGPDVDADRDALFAGLWKDGALSQVYQVTGLGPTLNGRNGGGDRYFTDGEMTVGVLAPAGTKVTAAERLPNPPAIRLKAQLWSAVRPLLQSLPGN